MDEGKNSTFLPEEIVDEIVSRLPVKPLFRFKCVSKRYKNLISQPKFAQKYLKRAYSSPESWSSAGLLSSLLFPYTDLSPDQNIRDLTNIVIDSRDRQSIHVSSISIPNDDKSHRILGSSNGLVLSLFLPDPFDPDPLGKRFGLCVSNPLTKQCVRLPDATRLTRSHGLEFAIAARRHRREQDDVLFLSYKIVIIRKDFISHDYGKPTTVEIFSSSTWSWVARELICPGVVLQRRAGFAYKGILHWWDYMKGNVITFDPFESPDRFGCIEIPNPQNCYESSLLYSGDYEKVKYCDVKRGSPKSPFVSNLKVWRLVDPDKGEWCVEGEFFDNGWHLPKRTVMIAPNPLNRSLICNPFIRESRFPVVDSRNGVRKFVRVVCGTKHEREFTRRYLQNPLIPIEVCPWSCPFYANNPSLD